MTSKKKCNDQSQIANNESNKPVEVREEFKLKEYFDILKSKKAVGEIQRTIPNDEAFKNFEDLIKTAKYREHDS